MIQPQRQINPVCKILSHKKIMLIVKDNTYEIVTYEQYGSCF